MTWLMLFVAAAFVSVTIVAAAVTWSYTRIEQTRISADAMTQQARAQRTIFHKSDAQDVAAERMVTMAEMHDEVGRVLREHGLAPDDDDPEVDG